MLYLQLQKLLPKKLTLTLSEMRKLPDIEETYSKEETSCLKWTKINGRKKVCVNFQTDTDKLNIVVYRYRNNFFLKHNEVDLKLSEYQLLLAKRVHLLSYFDIFHNRCNVLDDAFVNI